jgi:glycoside/pentoside/hexuronide:cation symporter, GPH family
VNINTDDGIALFSWADATIAQTENVPTKGKSFSMEANKQYTFIAEGEENIEQKDITIIDQKRGYSNSIYILSIVLALSLFITFATTKERVKPLKTQQSKPLKRPERPHQKPSMDHFACYWTDVPNLQFD